MPQNHPTPASAAPRASETPEQSTDEVSLLNHLGEMAVFARVLEAGSFSAAARQLALSTSAVSKQIGRLEHALGVRLLNRSTRALSLTDAGRAVHTHCAQLVAAANSARDAAKGQGAAPAGRLRISAPIAYGTQHIAAALPGFLARYPQIEVELVLLDRAVDAQAEGFDLIIQHSAPGDGSLVSRPLAASETVVCAAPAYLAQRDRPGQPEELAAHNCLRESHAHSELWRFIPRHDAGKTDVQTIRVSGNYRVNSHAAIVAAALAGIGIARLPRRCVADELAKGSLCELLPNWRTPDVPAYAVGPAFEARPPFAAERSSGAAIRAFIEHLLAYDAAQAQIMAAATTEAPIAPDVPAPPGTPADTSKPAHDGRAFVRPSWMGW
ncbi:LysR family transcriptional regulator [Rhodocyclus tenuis]|uniref:LysR family transcriptional regulator n=1 Tax=Rhodocyclus gracilis TaxID=2929842 RepID=A0ABX0WHG8_9RHOO|nr:LysR family transcriptional regulator [Rhodocyclus gracilis]NJA88125.1 LysR family transcriptional regulator [Rhodocyclus gracilis]